MRKIILLAWICVIACACAAQAADERMLNPNRSWRSNPPSRIFIPGARIALPDGRRALIETILPNGQIETDLGVYLNPDGTLVDNPDARAVVIDPPVGEETPLVPEIARDDAVAQPETVVPDGVPATPLNTPRADVVVPETLPKAAVTPESAPLEPKTAPGSKKGLSLAEMIPLTEARQPQASEPVKPEMPKAEIPKQEKKPEAKPAPKAEKKPEPPKKAKHGEELRIPEEAIKTGNLSFLEGCWQGTRPEYFSKRIIKECFCFGANGKGGKRRVIDQIGGRNCIGATSASLSRDGTLSVTSKGAACDDGEHWGRADMICRNSGQKTPCSWVFRDANNGQQSYTIPFVKVDSCGR